MRSQFSLPRVSTKKPYDQQFEDRVRNIFQYCFQSDEATSTRISGFQIDCYARIKNCYYIVECKTKNQESTTTLRDYIVEFTGKIPSISTYLKDDNEDATIVYILCEDGFTVTEKERNLCKTNSIFLWESSYIKNIENLYLSIGPRVLQYANLELGIREKLISLPSGVEEIRIPALAFESMINGKKKTMYNLFLSAEHLLDLGYVFRISNGDPEAYQRILNRKRLNGVGGIAEFIDDSNTFNSSIVVVLNDKDLRFRELGSHKGFQYKTGFLYIPNNKGIMKIIDGQHRIYGYEWADEVHMQDQLPVIVLTGLSSAEQAKVFLDINDHQKPVPKNDLNLIMARTDPYETGFLPNVVLQANNRQPLKNIFQTPLSISMTSKVLFANAVKGLSDRKLFTNSYSLVKHVEDLNQITDRVIDECSEILCDFYEKIIEVARTISTDWINDYIFTNNGFNSFLYLLVEVSRYYEGPYNKNWITSELRSGLSNFFINNLSRVSEMRAMSSEGGRRENAKVLIYELNKTDKAFGAKFIKDHEPLTERKVKSKGEYFDQTDEIEKYLKTMIASIFKEKVGENWWIQFIPHVTRDKVTRTIDNERNSYVEHKIVSKENYLSWGDIEYLIDKNDKLFKKILGDKTPALNAIYSIKNIRNKLFHNRSLEDLSAEEKNEFERSYRELKRRLSKHYSIK